MAGVLEGRVAVITGSGGGIGKATALAMAREGARVVVSDIVAGAADGVAQEIIRGGGQAIAFSGDISNFQTAEKLMRAAVDKFGRLDILHNNAGISNHHPIYEFPEKDWDSVIAVNLKGTFNCIRHATPYMMKQKWGRIINVSSIVWTGTATSASYSASKAAVIGLTGTASKDLSEYGITCNAYMPTAGTRLLINDENIARFKKGYREGLYSKEMYEQLMNPPPPEKVPPLIIFLCTDDATRINGQIFTIDGDYIALYSAPYKKTTIFKQEGPWTIDELKKAVPETLLK